MIELTTVTNDRELEQILDLQQRNLPHNIGETEMKEEGFVTLVHDIDVLQKMHELGPSVIALHENKIIGYALVMHRGCRQLFPPLEPMFAKLDMLQYNLRPLNNYEFYVMGQVCIDKEFRGKGIFDSLYHKHKELHSGQYSFILTEVATRNERSLRAHKRVGFQTLNIYRDKLDEWAVILWNWNPPSSTR